MEMNFAIMRKHSQTITLELIYAAMILIMIVGYFFDGSNYWYNSYFVWIGLIALLIQVYKIVRHLRC